MHKLRAILMLELRSLFGINRIFYTTDQRKKRNALFLCAIFLLLIVMIAAYIVGLVYGLSILGLSDITLSYLVIIASILILVFGFFRSGVRIFERKGYDILSSMPLKKQDIVISRLFALYVEDLFVTLLILLPGGISYAILEQPTLAFYGISLLGALLIPVIPLMLSACIGTLIMALSARTKHKSLIQTGLMLFVLIAVLLTSYGMGRFGETITSEQLANLAQMIDDLFRSVYLPAAWLGDAMNGSDPFGALWFSLISLGSAIGFICLATVLFHPVLQKLGATSAKHDYQIGRLEQKSLLRTLYLREAKRYFSSPIYVTNTIVGPILGCIMSVVICIFGIESMIASIPIPLSVNLLLPVLLAIVFCMMTTTSISISMEGKQIWVMQTLPIPTKAWLDGKLLFNLVLILPFYMISEVCLIFAISPNFMELLWLIFYPLLLICFSCVIGISINLKLHTFDWEREEQIVKQSAPAALGGFAGPLISILFGVALFLIPSQFSWIVQFVSILVLLVGTLLLYRFNNKARSDLL